MGLKGCRMKHGCDCKLLDFILNATDLFWAAIHPYSRYRAVTSWSRVKGIGISLRKYIEVTVIWTLAVALAIPEALAFDLMEMPYHGSKLHICLLHPHQSTPFMKVQPDLHPPQEMWLYCNTIQNCVCIISQLRFIKVAFKISMANNNIQYSPCQHDCTCFNFSPDSVLTWVCHVGLKNTPLKLRCPL